MVDIKKWASGIWDKIVVTGIWTFLKYAFGTITFPFLSGVVLKAVELGDKEVSIKLKTIVILSVFIISVFAALLIYGLRYRKFFSHFNWDSIYTSNTHTLSFIDDKKCKYTETIQALPCKSKHLKITNQYDWQGLIPKKMTLRAEKCSFRVVDSNGMEHFKEPAEGNNELTIDNFSPTGVIYIDSDGKCKKSKPMDIEISIELEYDASMERELYINIYKKTNFLELKIETPRTLQLSNVEFHHIPLCGDDCSDCFEPADIKRTQNKNIYSKTCKPILFTKYRLTWDFANA